MKMKQIRNLCQWPDMFETRHGIAPPAPRKGDTDDGLLRCAYCAKVFVRQPYLIKHQANCAFANASTRQAFEKSNPLLSRHHQ